MKMTVDTAALKLALDLCAPAVAGRTPRQQLTCYQLIASKEGAAGVAVGHLDVYATDGAMSLRRRVDAVDVHTPGKVLLDADRLRQIVGSAPEPTLVLESEKMVVDIKGQNSSFKLYTVNDDDLAPLDGEGALGKHAEFKLAAGQLALALGQVNCAMSVGGNSRYAIGGVAVMGRGDTVDWVATDGRRLAWHVARLKTARFSAILPEPAVRALRRLDLEAGQEVVLRMGETRAQLFTDGLSFSTALVEGSFPPFAEVMPSAGNCPIKVHVGTEALTSALERASAMTNEESRGVKLAAKGSQLVITSRAAEMGEGEIRLEAQVHGGEIEIGIAPKFLIDGARAAGLAETVLHFTGPSKPALIEVAAMAGGEGGADRPHYRYCCMPINLM